MLMRQSAVRCFGQVSQGFSGKTNPTILSKYVGLTSTGMQSIQQLNLSSDKTNILATRQQSLTVQGSITILQNKQTKLPSNVSASRAMSSNHPQIWTAEKLVSLACVPAIILPFMWTTPLTDAIFCTIG